MTTKSHPEACRGVTLTSDSLSSASSSSPSGGRLHPGRTTASCQDPSEPIQTLSVPDAKVLDMSMESEMPTAELGRCAQTKNSRWNGIEKKDFDWGGDPDIGSCADDVSLSDHCRSAVDLSTSKTSGTDADEADSLRNRRVTADSDLDAFPDASERQRASQLPSSSKLIHD